MLTLHPRARPLRAAPRGLSRRVLLRGLPSGGCPSDVRCSVSEWLIPALAAFGVWLTGQQTSRYEWLRHSQSASPATAEALQRIGSTTQWRRRLVNAMARARIRPSKLSSPKAWALKFVAIPYEWCPLRSLTNWAGVTERRLTRLDSNPATAL